MSTDLFERNPDLWKVNDADWMRQRKREWLKVRYRLSFVELYLEDGIFDLMQRYFLYGDVEFPGYGLAKGYSDEYIRGDMATAVLQIWFFPGDVDPAAISPSRNHRFDLEGAQIQFKKDIHDRILAMLPCSERDD